jgi:steroid delta-isomerase-like uncharacterized protein
MENKAIFRRFYEEAWNHDNLSVIDELLAPDFINHEVPDNTVSHRELYKQAVIENRTALPDWSITIVDLIAEDDKVVARWQARGTHTGSAWGFEPSGKRIEMEGITIVRVQQGKITDFWKQDNGYRFWQQVQNDAASG